jgi:hypothetical protein
MPEYTQVTAHVPDNAGWMGVVTRQPVTELKVINMVADSGFIVAHIGSYQVGLTPQTWDALFNAVFKSTPTPRLTLAEKLDAAAAVDDNGEAFAKTLNGFIGSLVGGEK